MSVEDYKNKLLNRVEDYPWIKNDRFVSDDYNVIMRMRQEYFFGADIKE